jgi:hypothetical protein
MTLMGCVVCIFVARPLGKIAQRCEGRAIAEKWHPVMGPAMKLGRL